MGDKMMFQQSVVFIVRKQLERPNYDYIFITFLSQALVEIY